MYFANRNQVLVEKGDGTAEVFLTIHPTHSTKSPEELAEMIAALLNQLA